MVRNTSRNVNVSSHRYGPMMQTGHGVASVAFPQRPEMDLKFRRGRALKNPKR